MALIGIIARLRHASVVLCWYAKLFLGCVANTSRPL